LAAAKGGDVFPAESNPAAAGLAIFSNIAQLLGRTPRCSVVRGEKDSTGSTYHALSGRRKARKKSMLS
jgi:hypothetical protein